VTRSVAQFIRDKRASQSAQFDYRAAARDIAELAVEMKSVGDEPKAREFRLYAFIAANAARAEFFDPEPRP
jgi:hypothetical protein